LINFKTNTPSIAKIKESCNETLNSKSKLKLEITNTRIAAEANSSTTLAKSSKLKILLLKNKIKKIPNRSTTPLRISDELPNLVGKIRSENVNTAPGVLMYFMHKNPANTESTTIS